MRVAGRGLPNTTSLCCANNNIFFEIHRGSPQNSSLFFKVYDSDPAAGTVDPVYQPLKIKGQ